MRAASAAILAADATIDANELYAALLGELLATLETFAAGGFAAIRPEWLAHHAFQDARVSLSSDFDRRAQAFVAASTPTAHCCSKSMAASSGFSPAKSRCGRPERQP